MKVDDILQKTPNFETKYIYAFKINMNFQINIFESDSDEDIEDFENIVLRRPRTIHQRCDHMNFWDDLDFTNRFRLSKETVQFLLEEIEDTIKTRTERNNAITPLQQLLLSLRFYATGSFQRMVGDDSGVHQSTACSIIKKVTSAVCVLKPLLIGLPEGEEIIKIQQGFLNIAAFPRVLLAVDGTHIRIESPGTDQAEWFRNRKGFFSINTQIACDSSLKIRNIVARWPGSANDVIIFMNSSLKAQFEMENNNLQNTLILGDSIYAVEKYFMVPLENPRTPAELRYQESHIRTRNTIERCIGVWKRRFPCLALGLRTKLTTTQDIIVATAIIHNIARLRNEPDLEVDPHIQALIHEEVPNNNIFVGLENEAYRDELINHYFANL